MSSPHFLPPYPPRPREPLPLLDSFRTARRNLLAVFNESCYEDAFLSTRVLARQLFICNSPDTVAQAFIAMHESFERKSPQMRNALSPLIGDGLFISDGATWKQRRRMVVPVVHVSRLPLFAPMMVAAASETADRWHHLPPSAPVDVLREMGTLTAEIICRTIFGPQLGSENATAIVASFSEYQRLVGQTDLLYMLGLPDWLPRWHRPAIYRAARRIQQVLDEIIVQCQARRNSGEVSMIQLLLDARDPETGETLDRTALRNEAAVIFMAGQETTANSLAWAWFLLSQAPEVEARFHAELDTVLGHRPPTLEDVPSLVFTRAVFDETVRLYPPVPILGRTATAAETIRGREIPTGSLVSVIPWLLHRNRKLWDKPDHFMPERFLPDAAADRQRFSYIPFSVGPRVCAGMAFGLTEAVLCLATVGQRVRLRLAPGTIVDPVCRLTLRPGDALPMQVEPR